MADEKFNSTLSQRRSQRSYFWFFLAMNFSRERLIKAKKARIKRTEIRFFLVICFLW